MNRNYCTDCVCLVGDDKENWICDEMQECIEDFDVCPGATMFEFTKETPCDYGDCPYNAKYTEDCRVYCGLGVDV